MLKEVDINRTLHQIRTPEVYLLLYGISINPTKVCDMSVVIYFTNKSSTPTKINKIQTNSDM